MKHDITILDDVKTFVNVFYENVRQDYLLGPIFQEKIENRWPEHLEKMYRFWQTVLLGEHTYYGSPFVPHATLAVEKEHFDQWLVLFNTTIDSLYTGEVAEKAKWQGKRMADMFHSKIEYYRKTPNQPLI